MSQQYPQGSRWRKWDLHVHTPASFYHEFGSWEEYIQELEKVNDIAVIGITDYFTIDGYKEIIRHRNGTRLLNFSLIVPNIELRLNIFIPKRSSGEQQRRLNLHVIFSDEVSIEDIETQFLQNLEIVVEGSPGRTSDRRSLTRAVIEEVGRTIKKFQVTSTDASDFVAGCKNITVSLSDVTKALEKKCFEGKYLLVLPTTDWDQISWEGPDYLTRRTLLQMAHAVFCGQEATINWCLGKGDLSRAEFEREFGRLKPSLLGSDAHKIERLCKPENGKFCWIKADPTFEGLKQIVYEPELRVKIQTEDPNESETYAKITILNFNLPDQLKIKDDSGEKTDFCLNGSYALHFSNNLTCIIGGRGSGKSTLAHIIYNSWINQVINKLSTINSPLVSLDIGPNPLKKIKEYTECEVPSQTEFFFQNEIEHAAKSIESMSTLIRHRLEKLSSIDEGEALDKLDEYWNTSVKRVHELIEAYDRVTEINGEIFKMQEDINTLKRQKEIIKSIEYLRFQQRIGELSAKVSDFKSYQTDFQMLSKQIDSLITNITQLDWDSDKGKGILDRLLQTLESYKYELNEFFAKYSADYNAQNFSDQLYLVQQDLRDYLATRMLSHENIQEIAQANIKIKELEEEIRLLQLAKIPYQEIYDNKSQIIEQYKTAYTTYKSRFLQVSSSLQERLSGLSISQKEVKFDLFLDHTKLKNNLIDFVKGSIEDDTFLRSVEIDRILSGRMGIKDDTTLRSDAIERLLFGNIDIKTYVENKQIIRDLLNESKKAEKHRLIIQELINNDIFLEKFHLRIVKYYFGIDNIQVQTKLGGKLLKNTSFGERCGIVIAIVLVAGTNPIVIDQPEDHLDGKFVSNVLVPLLRNQKHNRQIILITRDANVVVGGDAELIHILEPTDQRTQILPSSIEDIQHREKYIWILDGGADAFTRREQKYDIDLLKAKKQNPS